MNFKNMEKICLFRYCHGSTLTKTLRVMKITSILLFVAMFTIAAESVSQEKNLSLKVKKGSLKEVLKSLKQSNYSGSIFKQA